MEPKIICSSSSFLPSHTTTITAKLPFTIKKLFCKQTSKPPTSIQSATTNNINNKKKKNINLLNNILNTIDDLISTFLDLPLHSGNDPKQILTDNFEPVGECPPTRCPVVVGSLPSSLDGAYIRNGPNPRFIPNGPYHLLDGDGMLHVVKISNGHPTFCCRYVKTHKFQTESAFGQSIVPSFISCFNGPAASAARALVIAARVLVARQFDPSGHGFGVANTGVARLANRIFAVCESDLPYEIKVTEDGDVITLGRHDFETSEPSSFVRMTAHPRVDSETGDAFAFRYGPTRPFLTFHRIDRHGRKGKDVPIWSKRDCTVVHDFGITEKHAVFPDTQLVIDPKRVLWGSPVGVDVGKVPRVGIIPRYAEDGGEMRWIETPGLNVLHVANAWEDDEEEDTIVMVVTNSLKMENVMRNMECSGFRLEMVTIDLNGGRVKRRRPLGAAGRCHELVTINPAYANKKNRYLYAAVIEGRALVGVEKLDLRVGGGDCTVGRRMYGTGSYSGESVFVAKEKEAGAEEDDGYLITYVHDKNSQESRFLVMDAKSPELDIIAEVKLPQRIPNGFHGLFVPESDIN